MAQVEGDSIQEISDCSGALIYKGGIHIRVPVLAATWSGNWQEEQNLRIETVQGRKQRSHIGPIPMFSLGYEQIYFDDIREIEPPSDIFLIPITKKTGKWSKSIVGLVVVLKTSGGSKNSKRKISTITYTLART
jgi:hypothetical protein